MVAKIYDELVAACLAFHLEETHDIRLTSFIRRDNSCHRGQDGGGG